MHNVPFDLFLSTPEDDFKPDFHEFRKHLDQVDTVFICNPDNPTGHLISSGILKDLCLEYPNVRFIIDESYLPFVKSIHNRSMAEFGLPNAIILNSMSKVFRIPGLRIGFVIASRAVINRFMDYYLPWSVNSLAQEAVSYIYGNRSHISEFIEDSRVFTEKETTLFSKKLEGCPEIHLFPTSTSFILGQLKGGLKADDVLSYLAEHKILIRNCSNFSGLTDDFVRFSLKDEQTNRKLADLIRRMVM